MKTRCPNTLYLFLTGAIKDFSTDGKHINLKNSEWLILPFAFNKKRLKWPSIHAEKITIIITKLQSIAQLQDYKSSHIWTSIRFTFPSFLAHANCFLNFQFQLKKMKFISNWPNFPSIKRAHYNWTTFRLRELFRTKTVFNPLRQHVIFQVRMPNHLELYALNQINQNLSQKEIKASKITHHNGRGFGLRVNLP